LNVIVEELNGLGLNQMSPANVARKILYVLPVEKYEHIVTMLHQGDLSTATPKSILGKINPHGMYMHMNPQDGSSSAKKEKDLALNASHKGKAKKIEVESSTSSDDDASIALLVRRTTKMLKKVNKNGVNFDSKKKKFFTSSKRKLISEMDCYNCGDLGHLAHQCPEPKKDKYKKKNKEQDELQVMKRRTTRSNTRRKLARRRSTTRRRMARLTL